MEEKTPHYEMIVFDAGGTLVSADWDRVCQGLAAVAADHGLLVERAAVRQGMRTVWQEVMDGRIQDRANSQQAVTDFWNHAFASALAGAASGHSQPPGDGFAPGPRALQAAGVFYPQFDGGDYHQLIDGAAGTLDSLRSAGYRLGLLSNWSPTLPRVLRHLGIDHFFEFTLVSATVGLAKPDPAIFRLAEQQSGCRPEQLLYVGDSPLADVEGSRAAGWDAALIVRGNATRRAASRARYTIDEVGELKTLLTGR